MVTPAQVKNTLRNSWYRLRSTVQSFQEIENGQIQLGQMYALCQNHLLGLDIRIFPLPRSRATRATMKSVIAMCVATVESAIQVS